MGIGKVVLSIMNDDVDRRQCRAKSIQVRAGASEANPVKNGWLVVNKNPQYTTPKARAMLRKRMELLVFPQQED